MMLFNDILQDPKKPSDASRYLVLDISGPSVLQDDFVTLSLRKHDPRRSLTQQWKFTEDGRLCCQHSGLYVQAKVSQLISSDREGQFQVSERDCQLKGGQLLASERKCQIKGGQLLASERKCQIKRGQRLASERECEIKGRTIAYL